MRTCTNRVATVLGRITDQSGAVISGVKVKLQNVDIYPAVTCLTTAEGLYTIRSLHPGRYVISVYKRGFQTAWAAGIYLNVQDNVVRDFALRKTYR